MLATGGSDGRVIIFSLKGGAFNIVQRLAAHDSSVSGLQLDERFLVTSGNDGRVRLYAFEPAAEPVVDSDDEDEDDEEEGSGRRKSRRDDDDDDEWAG